MKKILPVFLSVCCLLTLLSTTGCAAEITKSDTAGIELQIGNPDMLVSGAEKEIDPGMGTVPVIQDERTLIPVRAVIEEMGGSVFWNEDKQEVTLTYGDDEILLTIDSSAAYLNGSEHTLDAAPVVISGRTMLPIRFIAESFKFKVDWNEAEQKITITKAASAASVKEPAITPSGDKTRTLTLYFSCTGNTKALAKKIHEVTGGDIEEIVPAEVYTSEDLNYNNDNCRANTEIKSDARPEIKELSADIKEYDTILIGYPIWWGTCPPVIQTLLDKYDLSDKTIMPFCTSGSSGIASSVSKIKELAPKATVTDGFRGASGATAQQIEVWLSDNNFGK